MNDEYVFMESPVVVKGENGYKLVWRFGKIGFYFSPTCVAGNSELLCSLKVTTSTGTSTGKYGELPLNQPNELEAIENNDVYWLEPNGAKIRIKVNSNV